MLTLKLAVLFVQRNMIFYSCCTCSLKGDSSLLAARLLAVTKQVFTRLLVHVHPCLGINVFD